MCFEIHCPECGCFFDEKPVYGSKGCPRCGNRQAFSMYERRDIEMRFRHEKATGHNQSSKDFRDYR